MGHIDTALCRNWAKTTGLYSRNFACTSYVNRSINLSKQFNLLATD